MCLYDHTEYDGNLSDENKLDGDEYQNEKHKKRATRALADY